MPSSAVETLVAKWQPQTSRTFVEEVRDLFLAAETDADRNAIKATATRIAEDLGYDMQVHKTIVNLSPPAEPLPFVGPDGPIGEGHPARAAVRKALALATSEEDRAEVMRAALAGLDARSAAKHAAYEASLSSDNPLPPLDLAPRQAEVGFDPGRDSALHYAVLLEAEAYAHEAWTAGLIRPPDDWDDGLPDDELESEEAS